MKRRETDVEEIVDAHLGLFRSPPSQEMAHAEERALRRLRFDGARLPEASTGHSGSSALRWGWRLAAAGAAAAALFVLVAQPSAIRNAVGRVLWDPAIDAHAVVETADGLYRASGQAVRIGETVAEGEGVRTDGGAGAQLVLADGSRVEMRSRSELALERADDGVRIRLNLGGIIVNAAKQRAGHLYVQTDDVTVSVVGTVFMVDAEEQGSRVAVIEGEVRVQQGSKAKTLLPGEQIATGPGMSAAPVTTDIAWSRHADEHRAQLRQFAVAAPASPPQDVPRETFEVVSIRPSTLQASDSGRGGGGGSGGQRNRRGTDPCSLAGQPVLDPRRFDAANVTLVQLVSWAYGLDCWMNRGPDVLFGGPPDWIRKDGFDVLATIREGSPGYTLRQLKTHQAPGLQQMLQAMLADRFKLVTRRETREMPVHVLSVAKSGPRFTRVNAPERLTDLNGNPLDKPTVVNGVTMPGRRMPPADHVSPEFSIWQEGDSRNLMQLGPSEIHGRKKTIADLVSALALFTGRPVLDRTGLTGDFNFFLEFAVVECPTCPFTAPGPDARRPEDGTPWPNRPLVSVLEQVGLELKPAREQVDVLVIERVERPTEN